MIPSYQMNLSFYVLLDLIFTQHKDDKKFSCPNKTIMMTSHFWSAVQSTSTLDNL